MGTEGSGGKNFVPQSFHSIQQKISDFKDRVLKDADFAPSKQEMKHIIHHQIQMYQQKHQMQIICMIFLMREKKYVLEEPHALACPNPDTQTDTKAYRL